MTKRFKVGDHVSWDSEAGHVSGKIIKVLTKSADHKRHAWAILNGLALGK